MEYGKHCGMFVKHRDLKKMNVSLFECFVVGRKDRNSEQFIILYFLYFFLTITECAF